MAYKEIVTKAVIGKGKKKYKDNYIVTVDTIPTTVLGCWIINHTFEAKEVNNKILITGSYDANIWYSYDNDTKTTVVTKKITYQEEETLTVPNDNIVGKDIIVRAIKQPTCISAKEKDNTINLEIEKELGIEIVGDTKVRVPLIEGEEENWVSLNNETDKEIDKVNPNYIKENNGDK